MQLDVKGYANINESFAKYCEKETMSGANQYMAEGHGLQVEGVWGTGCRWRGKREGGTQGW